MRPRSKAVALSISLVIAASGGGAASAASQPSPAGKDAAPVLLEDVGPGPGDDEATRGDRSAAEDQGT